MDRRSLQDIGLPYYPQDSIANSVRSHHTPTVNSLGSREIRPHRLELAESLAELDDAYDTAFTTTDHEDLDAEVPAEAQRIADLPASDFP